MYKVKIFFQSLRAFSSDTAGQLNVLWHNRDALSVDGAEIGVLEKPHEVSLAGFLQSHYSRALESQIRLEILGNFSYQSLEGQFADQKFSRFLIPADFS